MSSINFMELMDKVSTWNVYDEELLLQKIRGLTEEYTTQINQIENNISTLSQNLILIH